VGCSEIGSVQKYRRRSRMRRRERRLRKRFLLVFFIAK
jgi:hypothetical protein